MANNTSGKSIGIKFGVLGGGSVSGESGRDILLALQNIATEISNSKAPQVKFSIDTTAMEQQFDALATSFATKLQTAISNISVTPGSGGGGSGKGSGKKNGVDWASLGFTDESQARAKVARIQAIFETVTGDKAKTTIEWKDKNSKLIIKNVNGIHSAVVDLGKAIAASDQQLVQMFTGTGKLNLGNLQSVYEKQFTSLGTRVTDYLNKGMIDPATEHTLTQKLGDAKTNFDAFFAGNISDANTFVGTLNEVAQTLDAVNQRIAQNKGAASFDKSFAKAQDFYDRHAEFIQAMPNLDEAWKKHLAALSSGNGALDDLNRRTAELTKNTLAAGAGADVLGSRLKQMFRQAIEFGAVSLVMNRLRQSFREMYQNVVDINSEMTQLQIVTGATGAEMERRFDSAAESAKRIGIAMTDLINSQTVYARLGYNMADSGILAEYTAMLSKVGAIDVADAQSAVTSIVKAFDVNVGQIEAIMDRMIVVGNKFPIGVDELAQGMMNAGSMLQVAGNSYVESLALLTAANTTVKPCRVA